MKCYYHPESDAVGLCRHCQRGLCPQCVTEYKHGLACKGRCETLVSFANGTTEQKISAQLQSMKYQQRQAARARKPMNWWVVLAIVLVAILVPILRHRQSLTTALERRYIDIALCVSAVTIAIPITLHVRGKRKEEGV